MDGSTVDRIIEALQPIADKLGEGARYLWAVYYKQTVISGVMSLGGAVLAVLLGGVFSLVAYKQLSRVIRERRAEDSGRYYSSEQTARTIIGCVAAFLVLVCFIITVTLVADNLSKVLNPGYHTIHQVLRDVRG